VTYSSSANGLPCVPGDDKDPVNENRPKVSKLQGDDALGFAIGLLVQRTEAMLKSMPAMLEATAVDALIIDPIQFYAELAPCLKHLSRFFLEFPFCGRDRFVARGD
jgi:hypothetical protein